MWQYRSTEELYHSDDYLMHYGVLGMKWGHHRYVNNDGTYNDNFKKGKKRLKEISNENIKDGLKGIGIGAGLLAASTLPKSKIAKGIIGLNSVVPTIVGVGSIADGLKYKKIYKNDKEILKSILDQDLFSIEDDFERNIRNKKMKDVKKRYEKATSNLHNLYFTSNGKNRDYYDGNKKITAKEYNKLHSEYSKKEKEMSQIFKNEVNKEINRQGLDKYGIKYKEAEYNDDDEFINIRLKGNKKYYGN